MRREGLEDVEILEAVTILAEGGGGVGRVEDPPRPEMGKAEPGSDASLKALDWL